MILASLLNSRILRNASGEQMWKTDESRNTRASLDAPAKNRRYSVSVLAGRGRHPRSMKKCGSFGKLACTLGCVDRYSWSEVVPHLAKPTMNRFGLADDWFDNRT